jgi:hypothetical protein
VLALDGDGKLYAGGSFTAAGGVNTANLAVWDGTIWSALGSGTNAATNTLALGADGTLYCGGYFGAAGGKGSSYFGIWHGDAIVGVPGFPDVSTGIRPAQRGAQSVRDVHRGLLRPAARRQRASRSVRRERPAGAHLLSAWQPAGRHTATWDGRDEAGRRQAAGVYHCRMRAGSFMAARRVVLIP